MTVLSPELSGSDLLGSLNLAIEHRGIVLPSYQDIDLMPSIVAMRGLSMWPEAVTAMHGLRAQVYIDKKKFLDPSVRREDGTEHDEDDVRSVHIAVAGDDSRSTPNILGCMRLIEKRVDGLALPVERHFDLGCELPSNAIEVSRFIAEHANGLIRRKVSERLIAAFLAYVSLRNLESYAIVEKPLFDHLTRWFGLAVTEVAPAQFVPKYNTTNLAIKIDPIGSYKNAVARYNPDASYPGPLPSFHHALGRLDLRSFMTRIVPPRKPSSEEA